MTSAVGRICLYSLPSSTCWLFVNLVVAEVLPDIFIFHNELCCWEDLSVLVALPQLLPVCEPCCCRGSAYHLHGLRCPYTLSSSSCYPFVSFVAAEAPLVIFIFHNVLSCWEDLSVLVAFLQLLPFCEPCCCRGVTCHVHFS